MTVERGASVNFAVTVLLHGMLSMSGTQAERDLSLELVQKGTAGVVIVTVRNEGNKPIWFLKHPLPEVARGEVGEYPENFLALEVVDSEGRALKWGNAELWRKLKIAFPSTCDLTRIPSRGSYAFRVDLTQGPFSIQRQGAIPPVRVRITLSQSVGEWVRWKQENARVRDSCALQIPRTAEFVGRTLQSGWLDLAQPLRRP